MHGGHEKRHCTIDNEQIIRLWIWRLNATGLCMSYLRRNTKEMVKYGGYCTSDNKSCFEDIISPNFKKPIMF